MPKRLLLFIVPAVVFVVVLLGEFAMRPSGAIHELAAGNVDWQVDDLGRGLVRLTERASGATVRISADEAGPRRIRRVPCSRLAAVLPAWYRPPPGSGPPTVCVLLSGDGDERHAMETTTSLGIPAVWTEFYEPLLADYRFGASGGSSLSLMRTSDLSAEVAAAVRSGSAPHPLATDASRFENTLSYGIAPETGASGNDTHLHALYVEQRPLLLFSFRAPQP